MYHGTKAKREAHGNAEALAEKGTSWGEPTSFNPSEPLKGEGTGNADPVYHSRRITPTMVQDPISMIVAQSMGFHVNPVYNKAEQVVAVMDVPEAQPIPVDEEGNEIEDWEKHMPKKAPTMVVRQGATGVAQPPPIAQAGSNRKAVVEMMPDHAAPAPALASPSAAARMTSKAEVPTHDIKWLGTSKPSEPGKVVAFKTSIGMHQAHYHDVVISDRMIALCFDARYKGTLFLPTAPAAGEAIPITLSYNGRTYVCLNLGHIFEIGTLTFLTLMRSMEDIQADQNAVDPFAASAMLDNLPLEDIEGE